MRRQPRPRHCAAHLQKLYPQNLVLLCPQRDFSLKCTAWKHATCSGRGRKVMEDANHFSLSLLNLPHAYSHLEQAGRQADTTPGLIWTSRPKLCTWKVQEGSMGSDHFPIGVTVRTRGNKSERGAQKRLLRPALGSLQRYAQYTVSASECIRPGQAMTVVVCQKTIRIWTGICCVYGTAS